MTMTSLIYLFHSFVHLVHPFNTDAELVDLGAQDEGTKGKKEETDETLCFLAQQQQAATFLWGTHCTNGRELVRSLIGVDRELWDKELGIAVEGDSLENFVICLFWSSLLRQSRLSQQTYDDMHVTGSGGAMTAR